MSVTSFDGCNRNKIEAGACRMPVTGSDGSNGVDSNMNLCYSRNGLEFKVKACEMPVTGFQACQNIMVYRMPVTGFDGRGVLTTEEEENATLQRVNSRMEAFGMPVTGFRPFKKIFP